MTKEHACCQTRGLQFKIDDWHKAFGSFWRYYYLNFLGTSDIVEEGDDFEIETQNVDPKLHKSDLTGCRVTNADLEYGERTVGQPYDAFWHPPMRWDRLPAETLQSGRRARCCPREVFWTVQSGRQPY
jgi:hypothetical protein